MKDDRSVILVICADLRGDIAHAFLQHIRDFDTLHDNCHFTIHATAPHHSAEEIKAMIDVTPPLDIRVMKKR